ncbi:MAG: Fe-S protein assembly co-chaperone HscB [Zoogloeaceae bacterium]|nr:Fe-S protein assembly co-chaperone HscB [Zoogloeaceae bacterium]
MDLTTDFFTLFQLAPVFRIDLAELEARYLVLQGAVHPDRFARADERTRRLSMQMAARANEACLTLKKPLARAQYLLSLAGHAIEAGRNACMEPEFLMAQMEWREAVQEARAGGDHHELERLQQRLALELQDRYQTLAALLDDQHDFAAAAEHTRQLMFLEKLRGDLDNALAFLDDDLA